jgi:general secretion pathway protein D
MKMSIFSLNSRVMQTTLICLGVLVSIATVDYALIGSTAEAQSTPPPPPPPPAPPSTLGTDADSITDDVPPPPEEQVDSMTDSPSYSPTTQHGSKTPSKPPMKNVDIDTAPGKKIGAGKETVSIDFPEPTELKDIIKAVGLRSGRNFILSKNISGKISIISPQLVTKEEAWQAFLTALNVAGFTTSESGKFTKIVPTNVAPGSNIKTFYSKSWAPPTDETITQIIPLEYIQAGELANNIRNTLKISSNLAAFPATNSLIVTDTGNKVRRLLEVIRILDIKGNQPQLALEAIKNTDANDIKTKIEAIFGASGSRSSPYLQKVIVDTRSNSLLLVGPPKGLDDVVRVIRRLDRSTDDLSGQAQIHIRPLDYAKAEELATTLSSLASGQRSGSGTTRPRPISGSSSSGSTATVATLGDIKITADKPTNSLIVQGSKAAFTELDTIIEALDKRRDQVYIEVDILDVNMNNDLEVKPKILAGGTAANGRAILPFGFRAMEAIPFAFAASSSTPVAPSLGTSNAILGVLGGKQIDIGGVKLTPGAFIFALKSDSNSNVLQTPNLLVADNEDATFNATERDYYKESQAVANVTALGEKWQSTDAALDLQIKPQISKADFINLELNIKAESFAKKEAGAPPNKNTRTAKTRITVANQQTIVIGGLTRDKEVETKSKIPILGDIPILGWLFRDTTREKVKSNLTIFITPYIVRDANDLAKVYEKKVRERDEFLQAFYGKNYKNSPVFSRMPTLEQGKVQPPKITPPLVPARSGGSSAPGSETKAPLPSEDTNPVVVPSSGGSAPAPIFNDVGGSEGLPPPPAAPSSEAP